MKIEELRKKRRELAHRKRRIIYNNDGDDIIWSFAQAPENAADFLSRRTTGVENTQVDTISYCMAEALTTAKYNFGASRFPDMLPKAWKPEEFLIGGRDNVEILLEFCRKNKIEFWSSVRMNDTHDQWFDGLRTPFKGTHPEFWLAPAPRVGGGAEEKMFYVSEGSLEHPERWVARGSCGVYYGADYSHEAVRQRMVEIISDICTHYDLDGIELDFLRGPMFFANTARGSRDAGDENRLLMTELMRRIRRITEETGLSRGRPFVLAIRVPDSPDLASAYGLDTRTWLKEGLVDILIAGEASRIRPWKETCEFGHTYGVPVYPCVIEIGGSIETIRGRALAAWAAGADGIYTFNLFEPDSPAWQELGDPAVLGRIDRTTPVFNANVIQLMDHLPRLPGIRRFLKQPPRLPLDLPHNKMQQLVFEAGEDGPKVAKSATPYANLCLRFDFLGKNDRLSVRLNGNEAKTTPDVPAPGWLTCENIAGFLRWGDNVLEITAELADTDTLQPPRLTDVQVRVTGRPQVFSRPDEQSVAAPAASGILGTAFFLTEKEILPPQQPVSAVQQWLLDELNFARPRVPGVFKQINKSFNYPADPIESPLPGWDSLAILFDTEKMGAFFEKEMLLTFFRSVNASGIKQETALHAGPLAGSHLLAGLVVRSRSRKDLEYIAGCFGPDNGAPGILPLPVRFLRAEGDGHLIPGAFALVLRGIADKGVFRPADGCWLPNQLKKEEFAKTRWKLD